MVFNLEFRQDRNTPLIGKLCRVFMFKDQRLVKKIKTGSASEADQK